MDKAVAYTTAEVAFVLREPVKAVKKALDEGPVEARLVHKPGARPVREIAWADLLYLFAVRALRDELTPKARIEFYHALRRAPVDRVHEVRFGRLSVSIDDFKAEMEKRARELAALAKRIEFRSDGEALLKGTDVEAHRIAALLAGGMSAEEVRQDYPSLTLDQIATAGAYAEAYPKSGRPYPAKTVKRALKGAGLEALDEVLDEEA
jgi:uncharacterized protein (DUF433 family)